MFVDGRVHRVIVADRGVVVHRVGRDERMVEILSERRKCTMRRLDHTLASMFIHGPLSSL
jgi:hypothetical protein